MTFFSHSPHQSINFTPPSFIAHSSTFSIQLLTHENAPQYRHDYIALLGQLTNAPEVSEKVFISLLNSIWHQGSQIFLVLDKSKNDALVGAASLLLEQKIVHGGSKVGHIEDVVVNDKYRGYGLGKFVIDACIAYATKSGCYKVILDCTEENVAFYQKCGFKSKEIQMRLDLPKLQAKL